MKKQRLLVLSLSVLALLALFPAVGGIASANAPEPIRAQAGTPGPTLPEGSAEPTGEPPTPTTSLLEDVIMTREPEPTATPGVIQQRVAEWVTRAGWARVTFLGLAVTDWIALVGSLLLVLIGYLVGTWLIRRILPRVVRRTATEFDDRFLQAIGSDVRWLVVLLALYFSTVRLTFVSAGLKTILTDIYFVVGLFLVVRISIRLIDLGGTWFHERALAEGRGGQLEPLIYLISRVSRVVVAILALSILLSYFGVNVTAFVTVLGLGGLAVSLAAKDTIADVIAGFIVLVDQPYRIGDRIEIQEIGTWGDVVDIGLRTTRIRTRDNRMVIVPNSVIGKNQVINYTFPDSQYRIQTHVGIAYGTDIKTARQILVDAVRKVEGVLPDKPVDALYIEMGDTAMVFRVRWWLESYRDTRQMFDKVHTALQEALDEAGIECPFPTQTLNVKFAQQTAQPLSSGALPSASGSGEGMTVSEANSTEAEGREHHEENGS